MWRVCFSCVACLLVLCTAGRTHAGMEEGRAAYQGGDFEQARLAWQPLAERGDRDAQFWLAVLHEKGQGVERDPVEALKWYALAWKRGIQAARAPALALRTELPPELYEEARSRIRAWRAAFRARAKPAAGHPPGDIASFLHTAETNTRQHPENAALQTLCHATIEGTHVTFVTADGEHVLLAAFTRQALRDPSQDIWLDVGFLVPRAGSTTVGGRGAPDRPSGTLDWAYVYDRNQDDFIDCFSYLIGPGAVIPDPRPTNLPNLHGQEGLTTKQLRYVVTNTDQVFWHVADDNYDGLPDAYALRTFDLGSGWVDGHVLVRSTGFDGHFDHCRFLPGSRGTPDVACRRTQRGFRVPGKELMGLSEVPPREDLSILRWLHEAARECGLTSRHFRPR